MLDPTIGNTPLQPAPGAARALGVERVLVKYERANPTGAHKDRAALAMVAEARALERAGITVGTCGTVGLAIARLAERAGLHASIFVPERYRAVPLDAMRAHGAVVVPVAGGYEDAVAVSSALAVERGFYDANPVGQGGAAALRAYETLAEEIAAAIGFPDSVWVPVGNGTTLAGVARGYLRLARAAGRPPPRVCGVGSEGNTAAIASIQAGRVVELDPATLRETPENEPLLNWHSAHAAEALAAVRETSGLALGASDAALVSAAATLAADGIAASCAGAASLAGLRASGLAGGTHVLVLTS